MRSAPMNVSNKISIFGYTNYRSFLADYYNHRKNSHKGYSYRSFSKKAGFSSPNFLKLVIDGKRNISQEAMTKFVYALDLNEKEVEYFFALVKMNQTKSDEEKEKYFNILKSLAPHGKHRELEADSLKYLSHWMYPVIREMVLLDGYRDDPYWIARRLNGEFSQQDVVNALKFLKDKEFISRDENGKWHAGQEMVLSSDEVRSLAIRNYHRQMLDCSKDALEKLDISSREFGALTIILPEESVEELKKKIKSFRQSLHEWAVNELGDRKGEMIVQVNFQMFPHSKKIKSDA